MGRGFEAKLLLGIVLRGKFDLWTELQETKQSFARRTFCVELLMLLVEDRSSELGRA